MVSVAIAAYNGELFFREQLESIVNQTVLPDEIIIRDDRSKDKTFEIAKEFSEKYGNIKWNIGVNEVNKGFVKNFIGAILQCQGDIIILCDQDDVWKENKVEKTVSFFEDPCVVSMHGNIDIIDKNDQVIKSNVLGYKEPKAKVSIEQFVSNLYYCGMSSAFRRTLLPKIYDVDLTSLPVHDWLVHALAICEDGFYTSSEVLVYRRYHENNVALNLSKSKREGLQQRIAVVKYYCDHYSLLDELYKKYGTDNKTRRFIESVHRTNDKRLNYLSRGSILDAVCNIINLKYYPTRKAYISDLLYLVKVF